MSKHKLHIFNISHEIICKYLEYFRKTEFKFKGDKSWDMIKWNAHENLFLSKCALKKLLSNDQLILIKSKAEFNGARKRCFTKEHIFPTTCLSDFFYQIFHEINPSFEQTKLILTILNASCYVWQDENINITRSGLNSDIYPDKRDVDYKEYFDPSLSIETNMKTLLELRSIRYGNVDPCIEILETRYQTKGQLNTNLNLLRQGKVSLDDIFK
jgi:hypothetical protein|tara:strand:- start:150 stop:788 length:639 start_codon:yes stop_codon:yes gene_type:complete